MPECTCFRRHVINTRLNTRTLLFCRGWALKRPEILGTGWCTAKKLHLMMTTPFSTLFDPPESARAISRITDAHFASYTTNGVVCLRNIFSDQWITRLRDGLNQQTEEAELSFSQSTSYLEDLVSPCSLKAGLQSFAFESPSAALACRLMDSNQVKRPRSVRQQQYSNFSSAFGSQEVGACMVLS